MAVVVLGAVYMARAQVNELAEGLPVGPVGPVPSSSRILRGPV